MQRLFHPLLKRERQRELPQAYLDGYFPDRSGAAKKSIGWVFQCSMCVLTKSCWIVDCPYECVCIKQQPHWVYSLNSSSGASKSSDICWTVPLSVPNFRLGVPLTDVTRATGRSFSVMMISSPGCKLRMRSTSFVRASWMVMVAMRQTPEERQSRRDVCPPHVAVGPDGPPKKKTNLTARRYTCTCQTGKPELRREVPEEGVEPSRANAHWILNPARLPIPPLWHHHTRGWLARAANSRSCGTSQVYQIRWLRQGPNSTRAPVATREATG